MGFMSFISKMLAGQPVFDANEERSKMQNSGISDDWDSDEPHSRRKRGEHIEDGARLDADGNKIMAEAEIIGLRPYRCSPNIKLWGTIRNDSRFDVYIDMVKMLGRTSKLHHVLHRGEQYELLLYNGPEPTQDRYPNVELYYRDQDSYDNFIMYHKLYFRQSDDGSHFDISGFDSAKRIRDI